MSQDRPRLFTSPNAPGSSRGLLPNDHVRMMVELLRRGGPELGRRWLAALLLVEEQDRETVVAEIERKVVELYADRAPRAEGARLEVTVVHPPQYQAGYIEQREATYEAAPPTRASRAASGEGGRKHRGA